MQATKSLLSQLNPIPKPTRIMARATATFNGKVIAETDDFQFVEGNVYFPPTSILNPSQIFSPSDLTTVCPWKGTAHYYNISVDGVEARDAAWYYPMPDGPRTERAAGLKGFVAFYKSKVDVRQE